jgi:hypothetical protein
MPSDPVKAVWWFMHWLLKVLVHFFWIPILGMVIYEAVSQAWNGVGSDLISIVITLLVGLVVWAILYILLIFANIGANVARIVSEINQFQQKPSSFFNSSPYGDDADAKIVEGTISEIKDEPQKQK